MKLFQNIEESLRLARELAQDFWEYKDRIDSARQAISTVYTNLPISTARWIYSALDDAMKILDGKTPNYEN